MNERRKLVIALGAGALATPFSLLAQQQSKVWRIGLLWNDSVKPSPYVKILLGALREKGYVSGSNLRVEDRVALEGYSPMTENAASLVREKVDLIVTYGTTATVAAAKATKEIPIVMIMGSDPVAGGLAVSLAHPGGNVTGISTQGGNLIGKRMELLKELVPGLARVGILIGEGGTANPVFVTELENAMRALKLEARFARVRTPGEIGGAITELVKARVGAIYVLGSTMLASNSALVTTAVANYRIPAVYGIERYVDSGGIMVYAASQRKFFVQIASYVDKVLKGAKPAELPIEQARDLELSVNLKTARAQGIKVPNSILVRADKVIE